MTPMNIRIVSCLLDQVAALKAENAKLREQSEDKKEPNPIAAAISDVTSRIEQTKALHGITREVVLVLELDVPRYVSQSSRIYVFAGETCCS